MQTNNHIAIQINESTLQRLIRDKAICLTDLRCLDKDSKKRVHRSFLVGTTQNRR